jgi:hypothetical protein
VALLLATGLHPELLTGKPSGLEYNQLTVSLFEVFA